MPFDAITRTPSAYGYPLLIKQLLHTARSTALHQEIVYRDSHRQSYATLMQRIGQLASALAGLGVRPGNTVAVMDWDSHRYLECFFATPMMGAVLQTVNIRLSPEQILYTLNHAKADVVLINREFLPILEAIRPQLESVRSYILIDDQAPSDTSGFSAEYESMLATASPDYDFPDFDENTRATTFYTTGTTGLPKGVYFSHRQLVLHTLSLSTALAAAPRQGRIHRDDVYMPITPMFHVHAWGFPYVATMLGLKQIYPGRYAPDTLLRYLQQEKVTLSHCVPTILHMLLTHPDAASAKLEGWKVIIGGSALPAGLADAALARGIDIFSGYGMSETCPVLTLAHVPSDIPENDLQQQSAFRTKTGFPIPLVDLHTVDADLQDTPRDGKSAGEIVVRAPWLTQGYLHNPEASEDLWAGGVLHTGDIGTIDQRGNLQVTDRLKDVIKTGGEWVSSLEIENLLSKHPAVNEAAVIGIKDEKWGERPMAMIVLKPGQQSTPEALKQHIQSFVDAGHISRYAIPDQIVFVESLPRTSVGKLNKRAMREEQAR